MSVRAWIQELFLRILNLESRKLCKFCKVSGIQDSRFKILRKSSWIQILRSWGCRCQWGLGLKNFCWESWILNLQSRKLCKVSGIQDSRFKILRKSSWIQILRSWGCRCQWGLGLKNFCWESWILNLQSRKLCKVCKVSGIQASRFSEKVLESKSLDLGVVDVSEGLDSRTFSQNLESWILNLESRKLCKVCKVSGIQDSRQFQCVCVHVSV